MPEAVATSLIGVLGAVIVALIGALVVVWRKRGEVSPAYWQEAFRPIRQIPEIKEKLDRLAELLLALEADLAKAESQTVLNVAEVARLREQVRAIREAIRQNA